MSISPGSDGIRFYYPEEVGAAYEAAEMKVRQLILHNRLKMPGWVEVSRIQTDSQIRVVAREIADAVIRSMPDWQIPASGDITDIPGVQVEKSDSVSFDWGQIRESR